MNTLHTGCNAPSSAADSSDLDGYSIPGDYNYSMQSHYGNEDFGFDPPQNLINPKIETYSPPTISDPLQLSGWSSFDQTDNKNDIIGHQLAPPSDNPGHTFELDRMIHQSLPNSATAISRFGQVTPPRSNSASSEDHNKTGGDMSPKANTTERRKRNSKAPVKEEPEPNTSGTTGRKRKNARKSSVVKEEQDDKRRQSLEKNRLAAAKCRINKKEKTEVLQRNSHEKAVHNAFLKEQVMRMKEEVQQMNALLLAHANCDGCKSPEEIQKHLSNLGNEFFTQHMSPLDYDYSQIDLDEVPRMMHDSSMTPDYFNNSSSHPQMLNPPLPEFDRAADFEVHSPMHTD